MTTLETAERVVAQLSSAELAQFRRWFAEFDGAIWDDQIESDAAAGRLDALAAEALAEYPPGKASVDSRYNNGRFRRNSVPLP